jgi:hypothetical protein
MANINGSEGCLKRLPARLGLNETPVRQVNAGAQHGHATFVSAARGL